VGEDGSVTRPANFDYVRGLGAVDVIDYGSGDDAYKRDWMEERRVTTTITGYNRRHPVGALLALRQRLRERHSLRADEAGGAASRSHTAGNARQGRGPASAPGPARH